MENLLQSNERTLVMFDAVCSGLNDCLALVHADIRQMTEHRNRLALIEQQQLQAQLTPVQEIFNSANIANDDPRNNRKLTGATQQRHHSSPQKSVSSKRSTNDHDDRNDTLNCEETNLNHDLRYLDERLADSLNQALTLNGYRRSSLFAKQHSSAGSQNNNRLSIFQVLLGKSDSNKDDETTSKGHRNTTSDDANDDKVDNRLIIDDINRQTRLAMQYSKQLEAQLFKVEDLRAKFEMHLKMGLVVKSVARAYVGNDSSLSLARNRHASSFVINDSSSLGTKSSLSSLNLSSWSSSRSKSNKNKGKQTTDRGLDKMFVSTVSLSKSNKLSKRFSLTRLISSKTQNQMEQPPLDRPIRNNCQISSQSGESPNYQGGYNYPDWEASDTIYASNTLNKSSVNLSASRVSLKGTKSRNHQDGTNKITIKEFIENIDNIETEFESLMGSFLFAVDDIQGFARICQGDVFEVTIKYGATKKFKTKISVLKDSRQKCDNRQTVFKASIGDVLAIKAYECKGLGKRVLLGHKLCETRDLFTSRSQLMTISLNQTGSIKLNLIVTWNPLHMSPMNSCVAPGADLSHISLPPTPVSLSTLSSLSSGPSMKGSSGTTVVPTATTTIEIPQSRHNRPLAKDYENASSPEMEDHHRGKQLQNYHNHECLHQYQQPMQMHDTAYQTVDQTYSYYIPPPDYLMGEVKYRAI